MPVTPLPEALGGAADPALLCSREAPEAGGPRRWPPGADLHDDDDAAVPGDDVNLQVPDPKIRGDDGCPSALEVPDDRELGPLPERMRLRGGRRGTRAGA